MDRLAKIKQLKSLAASNEDIHLIDRIEVRRRAIMGNNKSPVSGPHTSSSIFRGEEELQDLHLAGLTFRLNMEYAPASIDTLIDLWIDSAHMGLPGFRAQENDTVLDIGANEGFYTLRMKHENPTARVLAVEPISSTYQLLTTNLALNHCTRSQVYPVHAAAAAGQLHVEMFHHAHVPTISSAHISQLDQPWIKPSSLQKELVEAFSLDEICRSAGFKRVDLIKIDVEGAEIEVLQGAQEILGRASRIVLEWHSSALKDAAITFLQKRGFRLLLAEAHRFGDLYFERGH
ncbi:MAG: FkbM family methyltransferase [Spirochaetia bacterium]|nr:FkbM family methyltransferase [Spirochaetia bacterium]